MALGNALKVLLLAWDFMCALDPFLKWRGGDVILCQWRVWRLPIPPRCAMKQRQRVHFWGERFVTWDGGIIGTRIRDQYMLLVRVIVDHKTFWKTLITAHAHSGRQTCTCDITLFFLCFPPNLRGKRRERKGEKKPVFLIFSPFLNIIFQVKEKGQKKEKKVRTWGKK